MKGQDGVYANLSGAMKKQAESIVAAMNASGLTRASLRHLKIETIDTTAEQP